MIHCLVLRPWVLATLAAGACAAALAPYYATAAGGADSSGYVAAARLFATGRISEEVRLIPGFESYRLDARAVAPLGMNAAPGRRRLVPLYPPGFPLHLTVALTVLPERAAVATTLAVLLGASLLLFAGLGRAMGLSWTWTATGMILIAMQPVFLFMAMQAMSDVAALAWAEVAMLGAVLARRDPRWAWLAGAGVAVAVAVRPSGLVLFAPVLVALPWTPAALGRFVGGGLPWALGLGWYNTGAHGAPWLTGYPGHFGHFSSEWLGPTLAHYVTWIPRHFSWPVVALALGMPWALRRQPRVAWILITWALASLGFYAAYRYTHETWWYLRFVLPAYPAIVLAALLTAQRLTARLTGRRPAVDLAAAAVVLALAATAVASQPESREYRVIGEGEGRYRRAARWFDGRVPRNAVVTGMQMTGALHLYTSRPFLRWDYVFDEDWPLVEQFVAARGRGFYALLFPFEEEEVFRREWRPLPGRWTEVDRFDQVGLWRYEGSDATTAGTDQGAARPPARRSPMAHR